MNIDSIIFDLDGTLWNPCEMVVKAWKKVCLGYGFNDTPMDIEVLHSVMGLQIKQIGEMLFPQLDEVTVSKLLYECCELEKEYLLKEGGVLYPNLEKILENLTREFSLFIVSNCESGYIETFLKHHGLGHFFKDIECAGNTQKSKGENIKLIIERNNLNAPIYVGDTTSDCSASKLAGIPFVYASYGFGHVDDDEYDYVIKEIAQLEQLIHN